MSKKHVSQFEFPKLSAAQIRRLRSATRTLYELRAEIDAAMDNGIAAACGSNKSAFVDVRLAIYDICERADAELRMRKLIRQPIRRLPARVEEPVA